MFHGNLDIASAKALREMQDRIVALNLPSSSLDESILVASWNIREFGKQKRHPLALHLIAEIIGQFDLISIVELRENVEDLATVLKYLGPYWGVVYSDVTEDWGGNWERLAFIYDKRAVQFGGMASTGIPPREKVGDEYVAYESFWRAPYSVAFRSGNFDFVAIAAHLRWGDSQAARLNEITRFVNWVDFKQQQADRLDSDVVVFGDFNTETPAMHAALLSRGLRMPDALTNIKTTLAKTKHYDHILHKPEFTKSFANVGGVCALFSEADAVWFDVTPSKLSYQLSDHFPVWAQVLIDTDAEKLDQLISGE
ncbi:endonuclease/exonuclease/phosphatase family protein [Chitinibacter sp. ZOR0017]|uniref:endonuclease/exonuclease/phosphatase family protein n=1 Tax=Chitinibacter sp. ZOR0017 TaxID=1339254 RepID=UPI000648B92E|nr:endonuclease/exonuclease/phosphatase family protein [Chitinibacter sp. ZOR0017]